MKIFNEIHLLKLQNIEYLHFHRDNVPVIDLGQWPLEATLFEGDKTAGPVPTLFSEDPEASKAALEAGAVNAHKDYQRAAKCFLMPETINLDEACAVVKKPR
jgi:hypothetical protein